MGATFNRLKNWVAETLTAADLNAEINNILDNFTPGGMDDYSTNVTEMQTQTDPGEVGTESLATNLAGELARIRHELAQIKGETYWYIDPVASLSSLNVLAGAGGIPPSRLSSGETTGNSNQSYLLTPQGSGNGDNVTINGATVTLVYSVDSTEFTLTSDVVITAQTAAPSTNNTALIDDASINDQDWTKWTGMHRGGIPIDTVGSEITSLNGKVAAFRLDNGVDVEYFLCVVDTTNAQLINVRRGWFFDENGDDIPAIIFANNDIVTLMNINWLFLDNTGVVFTTYNEPTVSATAPSTPATGDFWYDQVNDTWKRYNGVSFILSNAALVGMSIIDENGDCVAARSGDFSKTYTSINTAELQLESSSEVKSNYGAAVGVFGQTLRQFTNRIIWDITTDLDTGVSEAASTLYFFYLKEDGTPVISDVAPDDFINTRGGLYYPTETWRCLGQAWNDASSNLGKVISYHTDNPNIALASSSVAANALTLQYWASPLIEYNLYDEDDANNSKTKIVRFPFYQSLTVPSGATLDHIGSAGTAADTLTDTVVLHLVAFGNYITLGASSHQWGQGNTTTTTAISGASDAGDLYTVTSYVSAINCKAIAHGMSLQASAGTWASNLEFFRSSPRINVCRTRATLSSGTFTTSSLSPVQITNLTHGFMLTGSRKIKLFIEPATADTAAQGYFQLTNPSATVTAGFIHMYANGSSIRSTAIRTEAGGNGANTIAITVPASQLEAIVPVEELTVGSSNTLALFAEAGSASDVVNVFRVRLVIQEMPYSEDSL